MESNKFTKDAHWSDDRLASLAPPDGWQPDTRASFRRFQQVREAFLLERLSSSRSWAWAAAVTCACILAFPQTRVFAERCVNACLMETGLASLRSPAAIPPTTAPEDIIPIAERKPAPDFTLADASGNTVRLSGFHGRLVLLNFWATWCTPCKTEIPWFMELEHRYQDTGLAVLGISMDRKEDQGWRILKPYIAEHKIDYRVALGDDATAQSFGVEFLPATFLIDKSGRIASAHAGILDKETLEANLKTLQREGHPEERH